jgi:hypothetical protein
MQSNNWIEYNTAMLAMASTINGLKAQIFSQQMSGLFEKLV